MTETDCVVHETTLDIDGKPIHVALTVPEHALKHAAATGQTVGGEVRYHAFSLAKPFPKPQS